MASTTRVPTAYVSSIAISNTSFRSAQNGKSNEISGPCKKRKREDKGRSDIVYGRGAYKGPWARYEEEAPESGSEVEVEYVSEEDEEAAPELPVMATDYEDTTTGETVELLATVDYMGRSHMHVPQDLGINFRADPLEIKRYIPKKTIHSWKNHQKAITQLRFFPGAGHLLLSASADSKIKLYDVYRERNLLYTISGHNKSVNDIDFNYDGTKFLSSSYDRMVKLFDSETGKCISKWSPGATPHVIRWNKGDMNHEFLCGLSNKTIVQYDHRESGSEPIQVYDHHLAQVNTLTFIDDNRRFLSTSDDKSLRAWEFGIPVPIKFINEPSQFSMVRSAAHPSGKYAAFQSMDNQITVYSTSDRIRQHRKKSFRGHNCAGYAIDVDISPDGQFVMSGDTGGFVCFYNWKDCKMLHKIQASDCPLVACQWHPIETSKVVTGDLNGIIKYWD